MNIFYATVADFVPCGIIDCKKLDIVLIFTLRQITDFGNMWYSSV